MYRLDRDGRRLEPLTPTTFAAHGLRERRDLQGGSPGPRGCWATSS